MHLARVAMLGAAPLGGGFVSRAVSYAAGSQVRDTARQHLPSWAGGQRDAQQSQPQSQTATRLRTAATLAGAAASGGAAAAGGDGRGGNGHSATAGGAAGSAVANGRAYAPPPSAQANAAGGVAERVTDPELRRPEGDFANERFEAEFRERTSPVSAEQARAALASLPGGTQRGVGQLVEDHGAGAREHLAYQAMGEWSPRSARRCARSPPPAPTRARGAGSRPSAMPPARSRTASTQAAPVRRRPAIPRGSQRTAAAAHPERRGGRRSGRLARTVRRRPCDTECAVGDRVLVARRGSSAWARVPARFRRGEACHRRRCAGACRRRASRAVPSPDELFPNG